jgi:hypothetical protein
MFKVKSEFRSSFLPITVFVLLSFFIGLTIAFMGEFAATIWAAFIFCGLFFVFLATSRIDHSGAIFVTIFILFFLIQFVNKITGLPPLGIWQFFLAFFVFGVSKYLQYLKKLNLMFFGLVAFFIYISLGALSTITGVSHFYAALYQILSNFKPLFLLIAGFAIRWTYKSEGSFWWVVKWFWLPSLLLVLFEWLFPGAYFSVFQGNSSPDPTGIFPSRAVGPFRSPSLLAAVSAMFAILLYIKYLFDDSDQKKYLILYIFIYLLLIVFSVQRQELSTVVVTLFLIYLLSKPKELLFRLFVTSVLVAIFASVFWMFYSEMIVNEASLWGVGTYGEITHPRAQLYLGAIDIANKYFPLGSGWGTYGGAGAGKFDYSMYYQLGFHKLWWFKKENYLMDTYWPNPIGETGFLGAFFLMLFYLFIFFHALLKTLSTNHKASVYWCFSCAGMLYLLGLSFTSPSFQDPMLSFLPLLSFGIAYNREESDEQK